MVSTIKTDHTHTRVGQAIRGHFIRGGPATHTRLGPATLAIVMGAALPFFWSELRALGGSRHPSPLPDVPCAIPERVLAGASLA